MRRRIALDWETYYDKEYSVPDLGYDRYCRHPRFDPYLLSVCDGTETWVGEPKDFNFDAIQAGDELLSVNAAFDEEVAIAGNEQGRWLFPNLKRYGNNHWHCVANMGAYLWNVRSLADIAKIALNVDVDKSVRERAKGKTPEQMKAEGWWPDMLKYGASDVILPWYVWEKNGHLWPENERALSRLTIDQGRRGVMVDAEAIDRGIDLLGRVIFAAQNSLPWVKRGKKPGSPIGIAEECALNRIPPPPVKAHNPDAAEDWEALYAPQFKFVYALRNIRKAKKTLATLETIKRRIREDGTVATSLLYCGAHTKRWAGTGGWNLQNMNKEPLFIDPEFSFIFDKVAVKAMAEEFDREHAGKCADGTLSSGTFFFDIRGLIVARPGMVLGPVDSSQIEPRVLNTLVQNHGLLDKIRSGMGIYEAFAREALGWTGGDLKTQNKKLYALSKADVLGLGFRAGWEKFITVAWTMAGVDITEGDLDFALEYSLDHKIHKRWKQSGKWRFCTVPENIPGLKATPAPEGTPTEDCCFIVKKRKRKGELVNVVLGVSVYGMRSRVTVDHFRANNPLIKALWERFDQALRDNVGGDLVVEGPHGGKMIYRRIKQESRKQINPDTLEEYDGRVFTGEIGTRRVVLHGGIITENLVQWVARMIFADRMLDLHRRLQAEDPEQWVLFSVHDEAVPEIRIPGDKKARTKWLEQVLSVTPDWFSDCPLGAEAKLVGRYLK